MSFSSVTEDLNPFIALPREDPISGSFLAPKINIKMAKIIKSSGNPKGPILILLLTAQSVQDSIRYSLYGQILKCMKLMIQINDLIFQNTCSIS